MSRSLRLLVVFLGGLFLCVLPSRAQQTLGSVNGTVVDSSGAAVAGASVKVQNTGTNLAQTAETKSDGSYSLIDLPIGNYSVAIAKTGFKAVTFTQILVRGALTTTVNATLEPGEVTASVTVTSTPLLNETDTTASTCSARQPSQGSAFPMPTVTSTDSALALPVHPSPTPAFSRTSSSGLPI
jgi:Carboxypeptidase regulatory-like domain